MRGGQEFSVEGLAGNVKGYLLKPAFLVSFVIEEASLDSFCNNFRERYGIGSDSCQRFILEQSIVLPLESFPFNVWH